MTSIETNCLQAWRHTLLKHVYGNVLEIGAGTGANLKFYAERNINLVISEPNYDMRQHLQAKIMATQLTNASLSACSAETIAANDETFDFVICTLVCCSVSNLEAVLLEIKRVLKPQGRLIFLEHVAAEKTTLIRKWQNLVTPFWRKLAGNCHLNRETEAAIVSAGFVIESIQRENMCVAIPIVRATIRGIAIKP